MESFGEFWDQFLAAIADDLLKEKLQELSDPASSMPAGLLEEHEREMAIGFLNDAFETELSAADFKDCEQLTFESVWKVVRDKLPVAAEDIVPTS